VDHDTPTYCTVTVDDAFASAPVPAWMSWITSLHGGAPAGIFTSGLVVPLAASVGGAAGVVSTHFSMPVAGLGVDADAVGSDAFGVLLPQAAHIRTRASRVLRNGRPFLVSATTI
jgi:hypothetical protein